ncbi:MAG: branched-chain amino acid ABC transporter permease [Actinomycetota bacterium]
MKAAGVRRGTVLFAIGIAVVLPIFLSDYSRSLAAVSAIIGILLLSMNLLTGFVGQISFCQFSFAALGACTVGSLVGGHHWSFWIAMPLGVAFAALGGLLVGIPALRLSGLFLAILTVAVALFFDRYLLAPGTWESFSGGITPWQPSRPTFLGYGLNGQYAFYIFALVMFLIVTLLVWNLRVGKTGRVLRAIRESEVAASTMGLDLTKWKLAAFAVSAGIAGLAGALLAVQIGSVSPASYDFIHSINVAAIIAVMGVGSIASAAAGGVFYVWAQEFLRHTPLNVQYFPLILGVLLLLTVRFAPQGSITKTEHDLKRLLGLVRRGKATQVEPEVVL